MFSDQSCTEHVSISSNKSFPLCNFLPNSILPSSLSILLHHRLLTSICTVIVPPGEKFKGFFPICLRGNFVLPTGASCYFASLRFLLGHHATKLKDPISISQDDKPPAPTVIQKNYEPSSALMEEVDYKSRLWHRHKNTRKQKTGKKERWRNTCIWFVRLTNCSHWGQICWNSNPEVSPPGWAQSQCHYHSYNEEKSVNYFIQWPCKQQELLHNKSAIRHAGLEGGHTNIVVPQLVNNRGCDLLIECLMLQRQIAVMSVHSIITLHPLDYEISCLQSLHFGLSKILVKCHGQNAH